jgi:hypothetical protein
LEDDYYLAQRQQHADQLLLGSLNNAYQMIEDDGNDDGDNDFSFY